MKHPHRTVSLSIVATIGILVVAAAMAYWPFKVGKATTARSVAALLAVKEARSGRPLENVLNSDGSLNLAAGFSGSLDVSGYRMGYAANGAPRFISLAPGDENWDSQFNNPGISGLVDAIAVSTNGDIYVGGSFTTAGKVVANNIAKWNGSSWSALGSGVNSSVRAIEVSGNDVYVGGNFTEAGGSLADHIAKWNGSSWSALGNGVHNGDVYAIKVNGNDLYVGGDFQAVGGFPANYIAKWNGSSWSALGSGVNSSVYAIGVNGNDVYVGGLFTTAGGSPANYIAKWNGSSWSALGGGVNGTVRAIEVNGSNVYVGGDFQAAGGFPANYIAKWNGSDWLALSNGSNGSVRAIGASGNDVYASGYFFEAANSRANHIARWNGSNWSAVGVGSGNGLPDEVNTIKLSQDGVYVGGEFTEAGGSAAYHIAKWNGSSWSVLGGGVIDPVYAIGVSGNDVYVGGKFIFAGGSPANRIAKWNGSSWSALGSGVNGEVRAIEVSGNDIYVGGLFTIAGGSPANRMAKWNGSNWSALGGGVNGTVYTIGVIGNDVYAAGNFTAADSFPANRIARWNGSSWSALGSGVNGDVYAIKVSGNDLYVAGNFTAAGGSSANHIAKWNGSSWSPLGSGVNFSVRAIGVSGSDVYVGGFFTTAGGSSANYIAKWNGSSWSALGSGLNFSVSAIEVSGNDLYVGGVFSVAGGKPSLHFGRYQLGPNCNVSCTATAPSSGTVGTAVSFTATATPSGCTGTPTYDWDFGDGTPHSSQQNPTHTYTTAGTYNWTMTASLAGASPCVKMGTITIGQAGSATVSLYAPVNGDDLSANVFIGATTSGFTSTPTVTCQITQIAGPVAENIQMTFSQLGGWIIPSWQAWSKPEGMYTMRVDASNGTQTAQSQTITVYVKPLLAGRLQVKNRANPGQFWDIDKIPSGTSAPTAVKLYVNGTPVATLAVAADGSFSSRSPNIENSLADARYDVVVELFYKDYLDVPFVGPPLTKERFAKLNAGWVELSFGKRTQSPEFDASYPPPIFMHHGVKSDDTTWDSWAGYLNNNGYIVFTTRHGFDGGRFVEYSDEITSQIYAGLGDLFTNRYAPQYFFICHSQGGVIARVTAWREPNVRAQLKRVYTIGTPHSGSSWPGLPRLWRLSVPEMLSFNAHYKWFKGMTQVPDQADKNLVFAIGGTAFFGTDLVVVGQENVFNIFAQEPFDNSAAATSGTSQAFFTSSLPTQTFARHEFDYYHSVDLSFGTGRGLIAPAALNEILVGTILPDMNTPPPVNQAIPGNATGNANRTLLASANSLGANIVSSTISNSALTINAGQTVDVIIPISTTINASFVCDRSGLTVTTSLVAPNGSVINQSNIASYPGASYANLGYADLYQINNPQPGNWKIRIANNGQTGTVEAGATELGYFEFEGRTNQKVFNAGVTATLSARLTGNLNGVAVGMVTGEIRNSPNVVLSTVTLRDDGVSPDPIAGDRVFNGTVVTPTSQGSYPVVFKVIGTNQGQAFQRESSWGLDVLPTTRLFTGTFSTDPPQDTDGDSIADQITERVNLNLPSAGQYTISADLYDGNGNFISHAVNDFSVTAGGARQELLRFNVRSASCTSFTAGLGVRNLKISDAANGYVYLDVWTTDINLTGLTGAQFGCTSSVNADLAVSSSVTPNPASAGNTVSYVVTVRNLGPNTANSVIVTNNLPQMTTLTSCAATGGGVCSGQSFSNATVTFSSLASGAAATITLVAAVNVAVTDGATLTMVSSVGAATTDIQSGNNTTIVQVRASNITCGVASYGTATNYPAGTNPTSIVSRDFDGDGKADIAIANYISNNVSVRINNGTGGFGPQTLYSVGLRPGKIVSADFNGDGKYDLATGNEGGTSVSVILNNGSGGFEPATNFVFSNFVSALAANDFNNDGKTDLAVGLFGGQVAIMLGNGSGGFDPPSFITVNSNPFGIASGDFNNDGKVDLAIAHYSVNGTASVFLGNGAGGFNFFSSHITGSYSQGITTQDLNGDGRLDLAVANYDSANVSVLLWTGSGFGAAVNYAAGSNLEGIIAGDFNADGKMDLAVTNAITGGGVSLLLGNGAGVFGAPTFFTAGGNTYDLAAGYLNNDGRLDLAAATINGAAVLLSNCTGVPRINEFTPVSGTAGMTISISGTSLANATVVRFNGVNATFTPPVNGTLIQATVPTGATTGPVSVVTPVGTATSASNFSVCTATINQASQNFVAAGGIGSVNVTTAAGCAWGAVSNASWIGLVNSGGGGNGSLGYVVAANGGAPRTGTISIAGQTFTVMQSSCSNISATGASPSLAAVGSTVRITGTGLQGVSIVSFNNNISATFVVVNDTRIDATVPAGAVTGPITLSGCSTAQTASVTICTNAAEMLMVDDGVAEVSFGFDTNVATPIFANRLTPTSYPATLSEVIANINLPVGTAIDFLVGNNADGDATINGTSFQVTSTTVGAAGAFTNYAVNPITINSGDFVVGYRYVNSIPNLFPANADITQPFAARSYFSTDNGAAYGQPISSGIPVDLLIRATIYNGGCLNGTGCPTLALGPDTLPNGMAGTSYSQMLTVGGGIGPYTFVLSGGILPTGVMLSLNGQLSGTPTAGAAHMFTVMATDVTGCTVTRTYTLIICSTITINPAMPANGFVGTAYSQVFTQAGGTGSINWSSTGNLPNGLMLNPSTGVLSGTPTMVGSFTFTIKATDANGCMGTREYTVAVSGNGLQYFPLPKPIRLFDTRAPIPGFPACQYLSQPLAANGELVKNARITCDGVTIPANAAAIVGNATVITPTTAGFITLWPDGQVRPPVSNLNFSAGQVVPNAFTVGLSGAGDFRVYSTSNADFAVDVTGYFAPPSAGGLYYHPLPKPIRLFDTRATIPGFPACEYLNQRLVANGELSKQARITCDGVTIPADAMAIVGNATVVSPSGNGFITLWPDGQARPPVSNLNFVTGQVVPNAFTVGLGASGEFRTFSSSNTNFIVDITGYYSPSATDVNGAGLLYSPLSKPIRLFDTRATIPGFPACEYLNQALVANGELVKSAHTTCDGITIPATAAAIVGNATVVQPASNGFITLWPDGQSRPPVSNLNYITGQVVPNAFTVGLDASGNFRTYSFAGTHFIVDVTGFFAP